MEPGATFDRLLLELIQPSDCGFPSAFHIFMVPWKVVSILAVAVGMAYKPAEEYDNKASNVLCVSDECPTSHDRRVAVSTQQLIGLVPWSSCRLIRHAPEKRMIIPQQVHGTPVHRSKQTFSDINKWHSTMILTRMIFRIEEL